MLTPDPDLGEAERLETSGDEAAAAGEPAAALYRQAQMLLVPVGAVWRDREQYDECMRRFERLQKKLYTLGADGRARAERWRVLAGERRFAEAAALLSPKLSGEGGMGFYASEGYRLEALADATSGVDARAYYESALEHYLLYSLMPARGDSEDRGYELGEAVLKKLERR